MKYDVRFAIGVSSLFLLGALVHELSHAVVALALGSPVIELGLFYCAYSLPDPSLDWLVGLAGGIGQGLFFVGCYFYSIFNHWNGFGLLAAVSFAYALFETSGSVLLGAGATLVFVVIFCRLVGVRNR